MIYCACMATSYRSSGFNSLSTTSFSPKYLHRSQIQKQNTVDRTKMASLDSEDRITYPQTHYQIPMAVPIMPIFGNVVGNSIYSPRVQRIKDLSLQKDILRDVTASEFALRVEVSTPDPQDSISESKTSAAIDYEKLISKLDDNLDILNRRPELNNLISYGIQPIVSSGSIKPSSPSTDFDIDGYNSNNLTARILRIKEDLLLVSQNQPPKYIANFHSESTPEVQSGTSVTTSSSSSSSSPNSTAPKRRLRILVREDGTVDWDGALAGGKEVARFGAELWERLNGKQKEEGLPSLSELFGQAQAKTMETEEIQSLSAIATESKNDVTEAIRNRDDLKVKLRQIRREGVAEIPQEDIETLRRLDIRVKELEKRLKLYTLNLDMEKVCEYIQQELEASNDPADQRLFIAEVALIDKQIMTMAAGLINMPLTGTSSGTVITTTQLDMHLASLNGDTTDQKITDLISLIDDDELNLICGELNDLKYRLGLDTQLAPAMDWGSLGVVVSENVNKIKVGLSYFGEGTKLLLADVQYAGVLLVKAVQGYTLKPREVNTLRRTGKDLLTLVPFTIILIIPLSPVGHVLVFSFIQRFFPDFYPSCYTEKRLNLKRLFKEIERKRDNTDVLGEEDNALLMFSNFNLAGVLQRSKWTEFVQNVLKSINTLLKGENSEAVSR